MIRSKKIFLLDQDYTKGSDRNKMENRCNKCNLKKEADLKLTILSYEDHGDYLGTEKNDLQYSIINITTKQNKSSGCY